MRQATRRRDGVGGVGGPVSARGGSFVVAPLPSRDRLHAFPSGIAFLRLITLGSAPVPDSRFVSPAERHRRKMHDEAHTRFAAIPVSRSPRQLVSLSAPELAAAQAAAQVFDTKAPHAILMDADSGTILFEKAADEPTPPASMAKLMLIEY